MNLWQFAQPQDATDLEEAFYPEADCAASPDLVRVAAVSAPAETKDGESVATLLNRQVAEGLDRAVAKAQKKGWAPSVFDYKTADGALDEDAWNAAYDAYEAD